MICPNCNNNNNDNSTFCSVCGTPLDINNVTDFDKTLPSAGYQNQIPQPTNTQQMYYQNNYVQPAPFITPVKKKEYLKTIAPQNVKNYAFVSVILTILVAVAMICSYFAIINTSFDKIPIISLILNTSGGDASEVTDEFEDLMKKCEDEYEKTKDDYSEDEQDVMENLIEKGNDCADSFSISNTEEFMKAYEEACDIEDYYNDDLEDSIRDIREIFSVVKIFLIISIVFCLIFSLLGGFFKNTVLTVFGMIFSTIHAIVLCPVLILLIILALHITLIVLLSMINKDYSAYKRNPMR